ncbi:uncharacterized protein LOC130645762 [Hydractinia symbiolongicarpus]|uniref:uncharacterized protein LOC130645762 n=1 Tax=Hydractinia symbiolongicarpus TaxID=13093 RepID=UPI002550B702|nr:uncharacterized protein LOC130645762 [Hydractinia symbiolongicarpus]
MAEYQVLDSGEAIENEFNYQVQLSCRPHAVEIKSFSVNLIRLFAILHIANASLLIGLGIGLLETLNKSNQFNKNGGPIWAGGFICVTGIIGMIVSFQPKNKKMVTTYVVFNIIASILSAAALGLAIAGLRVFDSCSYLQFASEKYVTKIRYQRKGRYSYYGFKYSSQPYYYTGYATVTSTPFYYPNGCYAGIHTGRALYGVVVAFALFEIAVSVTSSLLCSKLYECCACCEYKEKDDSETIQGINSNTQPLMQRQQNQNSIQSSHNNAPGFVPHLSQRQIFQ